jgi:hypothetical protein
LHPAAVCELHHNEFGTATKPARMRPRGPAATRRKARATFRPRYFFRASRSEDRSSSVISVEEYIASWVSAC